MKSMQQILYPTKKDFRRWNNPQMEMNVWDYINSVIWYAVSQKTKNILGVASNEKH